MRGMLGVEIIPKPQTQTRWVIQEDTRSLDYSPYGVCQNEATPRDPGCGVDWG